MKSGKKILWALDAFSENSALHKKVISVLQAWSKKSDTQIFPTFVLCREPLSPTFEAMGYLTLENQEHVAKNLKRLVKPLANAEKPTILRCESASLRKSINTLLEFARREDFDLIVLSTQSRKGMDRFFFGSFAETLALKSDIPLLLISPHTQVSPRFDSIFYPTDFSEESQRSFQRVIDLAAEKKMSITLFHEISHLTPFELSVLDNEVQYKKALDKDILNRKIQMEDLAGRARAKGIKVHVALDTRPNFDPIPKAIQKAAKKAKSSMIAISSHSGFLEANLLGSVARQLIRNSKVPVWVIHEGKRGEASKKKRSSENLGISIVA